ncbi:MAG: response regulator [Bacteroidota bacterium]
MTDPLVCLLIDDDHDDSELFQLAIERTKIPVDCIVANSAIQALSLLKDDENIVPDFIFVDLNMPMMNGRECIKELKKMEKLKDAVIIVYSTSSDRQEINEMLELGASHFITKPSDISNLENALIDCLQHKQ